MMRRLCTRPISRSIGFSGSCISKPPCSRSFASFTLHDYASHERLHVPPVRAANGTEAVTRCVRDHMRIYLQTAAATPQRLVKALAGMNGTVKNVEIISMHTEGPAPYLDPSCEGSFRANCMFIGSNARKAVNEGRADFTPVFFSEVPLLFRRGILPIDVALVTASPPDRHGWCSLGVSVDCSLAAVQTAKFVICQINKNMPRTHGDGLIHINHMDYVIEGDDPLPEHVIPPPTNEELSIAKHVASLIPDAACLQMGIGSIPNAVLSQLKGHRDIGIHTEMFADGLLELLDLGVVNNKAKAVHPNKIVSTFLIGTKRVYDFVDDNPQVVMLDVQYVNDPYVISRNPKVHAVNSAIEVDLTGQVCADSIGSMFYSGVGGQMDFMRGAALSTGGKPIIALPSVTSKGESRIVPFLKQGAGVVTTRAHVHYVVTEYGVAEMLGKNVRQRALALANIAHPNHRNKLYEHIQKIYAHHS